MTLAELLGIGLLAHQQLLTSPHQLKTAEACPLLVSNPCWFGAFPLGTNSAQAGPHHIIASNHQEVINIDHHVAFRLNLVVIDDLGHVDVHSISGSRQNPPKVLLWALEEPKDLVTILPGELSDLSISIVCPVPRTGVQTIPCILNNPSLLLRSKTSFPQQSRGPNH